MKSERMLAPYSCTCSYSYLTGANNCQWYAYIVSLLQSSVRCVSALHDERRSVLVHCSDGWDRTAQIVSTAKLLLDPYYRTIEV
jgi:protein tyrosine phosphatase